MTDTAPLLAAALGVIGVLSGALVWVAKRSTRGTLTRADLATALSAALEAQGTADPDSIRSLRAVVDSMRVDLARVITQARRLFELTDEHREASKEFRLCHEEIREDLRVMRQATGKLAGLKDEVDALARELDKVRRENSVNKSRAS